jgi:hypothetical protein
MEFSAGSSTDLWGRRLRLLTTGSWKGAIEDAMEIEEMVEVDGGEDVAEVRPLRSASVVAVGAEAIVAAVEAAPLLVGPLPETHGREILRNFRTQAQTRGRTHTPPEWEFPSTVAEWSRWSRAISGHQSGRGVLAVAEDASQQAHFEAAGAVTATGQGGQVL